MSVQSINKRVGQIERSTGKDGFILVYKRDGETADEAIEREIAAGRFTERDRANRLVVVLDRYAAMF